jgi:hypothetical protein
MSGRGLPAVACALLASVSLSVSVGHAAPAPGITPALSANSSATTPAAKIPTKPKSSSKASGSKTSASTPFYSAGAILQWMNNYRDKPDPMRAAAAIHEASGLGELRNPESAGVYLGFAAGVLADNPAKADALVDKMLPLPAEDQWLIVRAIAYSDIPQWRGELERIAPSVTAREPMLQKYVAGKLPTLAQFKLEEAKQDWFQRVTKVSLFTPKPKTKPVVLAPTPELLDTFWGFYYATGDGTSLQHIMSMLPWAKNHDDLQKLTLGGMAKYTLAQNASRDPVLLATLKTVRSSEPKDVKPVLDEVIEAADDVDVSHVRSEMLASLDELKTKGPASKRDASFWGQIGEGAIAAGCIGAAVVGQVEFGIPCVVGGAVSSGALRLWTAQD